MSRRGSSAPPGTRRRAHAEAHGVVPEAMPTPGWGLPRQCREVGAIPQRGLLAVLHAPAQAPPGTPQPPGVPGLPWAPRGGAARAARRRRDGRALLAGMASSVQVAQPAPSSVPPEPPPSAQRRGRGWEMLRTHWGTLTRRLPAFNAETKC